MKAAFAIAARFRSQIARGELEAGMPLPVENELVAQLGVSKAVVREALRILEMEGLVEVRRGLGGGPRVRHPSISDAAHAMGVYLQIGDVPVLDVWAARDRIVGGAVRALASAPGNYRLDPFEEAVWGLAAAVGNLDAYYPRIIEVGEVAVEVAGNQTEHVLVRSLRHILGAELEAATKAVEDIDLAIDVEGQLSRAWIDVLKYVQAGDPIEAVDAYERQAAMLRNGMARLIGEETVIDLFGGEVPSLPTEETENDQVTAPSILS